MALHWGMLCSVFALVFARDGPWDCQDRDDVLREVSADAKANAAASAPSSCTLDCTARTYRVVLLLQNRLTIRFIDSQAGDADEFCWSTGIKCSPGQRLQRAFVLLPVDLSVADRETLRLRILSETHGATVPQHAEYSLFPPECGLRFDVTEHLASAERHETLCVRIVTRAQSTLGSGLTCPPFLVTTWEKWNRG